VTDYGLHGRGVGVPSLCRIKDIHFSISSRPALGPTQRGTAGCFPRGGAAGA
jgi:hypothetical protein